MTQTRWNGVSGDWGDAADWSAGVPTATSTALIQAAGPYQVTIAQTASYAAAGVDLRNNKATLDLAGTLTAGEFDLAVGALALTSTGVLDGAELEMNGGLLTTSGGTFDAVHVIGALTLTGEKQTLNIVGSLTATNSIGGAGVIDLAGANDVLAFAGTQTFDNASIVIDSATGSYPEVDGPFLAHQTLTFGPDATITTTGASASGDVQGGAIVNQGTITASAGTGRFQFYVGTLINEGSISLDIQSSLAGDLDNAAGGVIAIGAGQKLEVFYGTFQNKGTISVGTGAVLQLGSGDQYHLADIRAIDNQGTIELDGTLSNQDSTIYLGAGLLAGDVTVQGTIDGGTIVGNGHSAQISGATLDAVAFHGELRVTPGDKITVSNGLMATLDGGPGLIVVDGDYSTLAMAGTQTLDNVKVQLGGDLSVTSSTRAAAVLTLGTDCVVASATDGADAEIRGVNYRGYPENTVINEGRITAAAVGGTFGILASRFINDGLVGVSHGDTLTMNGEVTNAGTFFVNVGGTLKLNDGKYGLVDNTGTISVVAGGTLDVYGRFSAALLGNVSDLGVFQIDAVYDNAKSTITLGPGSIFGGADTVLGSNGVISGGTVVAGTGYLDYDYGELAGVAVHGPIELTNAGAVLSLGKNVLVKGADGTGSGFIDDTGADAGLWFRFGRYVSTINFNGATIQLGNATQASSLLFELESYGPATLTLGAFTQVMSDTDGALATLGVDGENGQSSKATLVNDGMIAASAAGGLFTVQSALATLVNNGQIAVSNGDDLRIGTTVQGLGGISIASGAVAELAGVGASQTVTFEDATGALKLDSPTAFAGTLSGARVGDSIDLVGLQATAAAVDISDRLIVTYGAETVAILQLAGDYSQTTFDVASDGAGGSTITLAAGAPSAGALVQAMAGLPSHGPAFAAAGHSTSASETSEQGQASRLTSPSLF